MVGLEQLTFSRVPECAHMCVCVYVGVHCVWGYVLFPSLH